MSVINRQVAHYTAQECAWQKSGELSVSNMCEGWLYCHRRRSRNIRLDDVLAIGALIEPKLNRSGLRLVGVRVGHDVKMPPQQVPTALERLLSMPQGEKLATVWFKEFEEIHPFVDGNGRTGSLLHNWLLGTLPDPIHPPNLWHDPRRDTKGYPHPMAIYEARK